LRPTLISAVKTLPYTRLFIGRDAWACVSHLKNGIPIAFWFDGEHEDYHQPGDEPQKIDYNKMEKVARTIAITLWELTNLKDRPKIDKELPAQLAQPRN